MNIPRHTRERVPGVPARKETVRIREYRGRLRVAAKTGGPLIKLRVLILDAKGWADNV